MLDRIGERKQMNCGLWCECIRYNTHKDCDFKFDNGVIVTNRYWKQFSDGTLITPELKKKMFEKNTSAKQKNAANKYLNKIYETDYGMTYKVIEYTDYSNILVEFNNGCKRKITQKLVGNKSLLCPNVHIYYDTEKKTRKIVEIGEKVMQKCGHVAELVKFETGKKCWVKFANGRTKTIEYKYFLNGEVPYMEKRTIQTGDKFTLDNGQIIEIINKNGRICEVRFPNGNTRKIMSRYLKNGIHLEEVGITRYSDELIGKEYATSCGLKCRILGKEGKSVRIEYEDGRIRDKVLLNSIFHCKISYPGFKSYKKNKFYNYIIQRAFEYNSDIYYKVFNNDEPIAIMTLHEILEQEGLLKW